MHPMLPLIASVLLVSVFFVMTLLWYVEHQEGKKSEDCEEYIYVIRGIKQQHELLKQVAEKENINIQKITSITF